jgi:hypothetical protein
MTPVGVVPPEAQVPDLDKYLKTNKPKEEASPLTNEFKQIGDKIKYLEQWISKIQNTGPGSGEVNLRYLDDVDRSTIGDGKYLNYNATTKKFQFSTLSGGGAPQLQSDWNQTDNTALDFIKNKPDLSSVGLDTLDSVTNRGNTTTNAITVGSATADYFQVDVTPSVPPVITTGMIAWNDQEKTFDMGLINGVVLQAGQELHMRVKAYEAISNGQSVMFAGVDGEHVLARKYNPAIVGFIPEWFVGVATEDLARNAFGYVTVYGVVHDVNTNAWNNGTILYADNNTAGGLTATEPTAGTPHIIVAAVTKKSGTGHLLVRPSVRWKLDELSNVSITTPATNHVLKYNGSIWVNGTNSYNDLTNKPTIPTVPTTVSSFTNDSNYVTSTGLNATLASFVNNASLALTLGDYASKSYVANEISNVIGAAPTALNTLKEIADQLAADESGVAALTTTVAGKVSLTGSYANPDWITSLAYSKLTGAPTALSSFTNDSGYLTSAAAGSLTGTTLKSTVVSSSLTSVGTLTSLTSSGAVRFTYSGNGSSYADSANAVLITGSLGVSSNVFINGNIQLSFGNGIYMGGIAGALITYDTLNASIANSSLTSVGTLNNLTVAGGASPISGRESIHYLNVGTHGHMFDDGNFHLHSTGGDIWLNTLESGRYVQLNTQGYGAGVKMGGDVISTTPFQGKSPFNSALNTEVVVDNIKYRIANSGGIFPQIESNTSGTVDVCWSIIGVVSGAGTTSNENSGTLVANNAWTTLYSTHGMDTRGDTLTAHITDKNAGRIYRATFMVTNNSSNTTGYNIVVERII